MKTIFISSRDLNISAANKRFEECNAIYQKIKDVEGIAYLEEILGKEVILDADNWTSPHLSILDSKINLDIVCSVVGELELALGAEDTTVSTSIENKQIRYNIQDEGGKSLFVVYVYDPICEWKIEKEEIHHYTSESKVIHHKVLCK